MRIAIIGAGISGLSTAFFLMEKGHDVAVFEKSKCAGGYLGTTIENGFTVEHAANGMLNNEPATLDLIARLKLTERMLYSSDSARRRYIFSRAALHEVPTSLLKLKASRLISAKAKFQLLSEPFRRKALFAEAIRVDQDETIADFGARHFGHELSERILTPASIGIFAGPANALVMELCFPKFKNSEREYGSLLWAQIAGRRKSTQKHRTRLFSFPEGLQELIDALVLKMGSRIHLNHSAEGLKLSSSGTWTMDGGNDEYQHVILCTPPQTWNLMFPSSGEDLPKIDAEIPSGQAINISFAFDQKINFSGFGVLVDQDKYDGQVLGVLHPPDIFPGRCASDKDLFTLIVGGAFHPLAGKDIQATIRQSLTELAKILGVTLPSPVQTWVWPHAPGIPQYTRGMRRVQNEMWAFLKSRPGLWANTNALGGVAVNDCIRKSLVLSDVIERSGLVS